MFRMMVGGRVGQQLRRFHLFRGRSDQLIPGYWLCLIVILGCCQFHAGSARAQDNRAALRQVACWFKVPAPQAATCYRLRVPEQRPGATGRSASASGGISHAVGKADPSDTGLSAAGPSKQAGITLDLPIVVISTPRDRQHDDPVVYISGGPGDGDWVDAERISYWWDFLADNPWLRHRDLILFDQRGVGMTEPRVDCPELQALNLSSLSFGNDHQDADKQAHDAAQACLARLQREGHDAAAYTTEASAEDLHDIFTALGLPRWNIYGLSYGTRLALTYMRLHPADIRAAILDSVYPPQVRFLEDDAARTERAFGLLFDACQVDADCHGWYPDLPNRLQALVERLNAKPLVVHRVNPDTGEKLNFPFTGETLLSHLFFNLYNRDDIERVPQIIDIFDRNLTRPVDNEVDLLISELDDRPDWGDAMSTTIDCLEDVPFNDPDKVKANYAASHLLRSYADADPAPLCPAWVKEPPIAAMNEPVDSNLPSLVLTGANDPVTPPDYARLAASHLPKAFYFDFPAIGHDVLGNSTCAGKLADTFLNQPEVKPADPCMAKADPFVFVPPVKH